MLRMRPYQGKGTVFKLKNKYTEYKQVQSLNYSRSPFFSLLTCIKSEKHTSLCHVCIISCTNLYICKYTNPHHIHIYTCDIPFSNRVPDHGNQHEETGTTAKSGLLLFFFLVNTEGGL